MMNLRDLRPGRGLLAAVAAIAGLSLAHAPAADAQNLCSTALSVNPAFCKGGSPAGCVPSAITDGMDVSLTVTVTNGSQFQGGGLTDPPSGHLEAGDTMVVYYACSNSVCGPTEVLAGYFTYQSHTALSGISFSDNGDGYSGTITVDNNNVAWAQGDTTDRELVTINLVGNQPPGTGVVFARAGKSPDQSGDILVNDDPDCIGTPQTGGGNGSTAAAFAAAPPPGDVTYCRHPNPTILKFRNGEDYLYSRLAFGTATKCDPSTDDFSYTLSNTDGTIGTWSLAAGQIQPTGGGRRYQFKDKQAKKNGGIKRLLLDPMDDRICMNFKGFEDLSSATLPDMTIDVDVCGSSYSLTATWNQRKKGWVLPPSAVPPLP